MYFFKDSRNFKGKIYGVQQINLKFSFYLRQFTVSELVFFAINGRSWVRAGGYVRDLWTITWLRLNLVMVISAKTRKSDYYYPQAPKPPKLHIIDAATVLVGTTVTGGTFHQPIVRGSVKEN